MRARSTCSPAWLRSRLSGYAILELFHRARPLEIIEWLLAAIVIHDLVLLPTYSLLGGLAAPRAWRRRYPGASPASTALNHLRIAVFFVVLPLFIWAPLIFGLAKRRYRLDTGLTTDVYLGRWLLYSGVVCVGSALLYVVRVRRACRPRRARSATAAGSSERSGPASFA